MHASRWEGPGCVFLLYVSCNGPPKNGVVCFSGFKFDAKNLVVYVSKERFCC